MDRAVPRTGSEEIELYIRTYYSLLRSTTGIQIRTLEEAHANMGSSLHPGARSPEPDLPAFIYSSLRLPACIADVERVVLGQGPEVFQRRGVGEIESWQPAAAPARRRPGYYDGAGTLACFIASRSDIDDIIPMLTAFQIEWNKLHRRLRGAQTQRFLEDPPAGDEAVDILARAIGVDGGDLARLQSAWGLQFWTLMRSVAAHTKQLHVRLLASSLANYQRATHDWWGPIEAALPELRRRPVYFVSSNTHSLVNLFTGFALGCEAEIVRFLELPQNADLLAEWREIEARQVRASRENFLYYALKKLLAGPDGARLRADKAEIERARGVRRFPSVHGFDVEVQVIDLKRFDPGTADPRLRGVAADALARSEALIVNIDYPLGMSAHQILSHISARAGEMRGVYVMGKAATLNGVIGDVMLPSVVHDEHSQNTYLIANCFRADDVGDLVFGTVLDNQKAISVRGTFLQNQRYMDVFYREGYTVIEMEAGPYLSAVYEMFRPQRYPENEIVNLYEVPFDLGFLHYASDTPLSKGRNLGVAHPSYFGMDPTYAASLAILRRILALEAGGAQPQAALD